MPIVLNNFPSGTRGTVHLTTDEDSTETQKIGVAVNIIEKRAQLIGITLLLHTELRGRGWVMLWWPANEPRHHVTDQIIN